MPNKTSVFDQLHRAFVDREITKGYSLLTELLDQAQSKPRRNTPPTCLLLMTALWLDVGYPDNGLLNEMLGYFSRAVRRGMSLPAYIDLRLVEAWQAMMREDMDTAIRLLDFVLSALEECDESGKLLFAHFFKARAHRKKGEYEKSDEHILQAHRLAQDLKWERFGAVIQIQEAWLLFQKGRPTDALGVFDHAEQQLRHTDDYLSLANIESARGRIVRRAGEYHRALRHYENAISMYRTHHPQHRNLARTLINAAYVKRLIALQLRKRIDARAPNESPQQARGHDHTRYLRICQEALADLQRAGEIHALHQHPGGAGSVLVNEGYLHLDQGNIDEAAARGLKAYELAHITSDHILMARARILESAVETLRVDEQFGEEHDLATHAANARAYADEAVSLATHTQNRRLLAGAWIARGMTAANDLFQDWEEAKRCAARASTLLSSEDRDHLWEDLLTLKARLLSACEIDETLRAWSEGLVGDKTFRQIEEEFAEIVIPRVWEREGRKISRVVERLSISPKKIRRVLRNTGLLEENEN